MMNHFAYQQNGFEMRRGAGGDSDGVVCPKPRRLCLLNPSIDDQIKPSIRFSKTSRQTESLDSRAGNELLDIILMTGNEKHGSNPYFSGSPPSRASNPVIQDARFGVATVVPEASVSRKQGGCVRSSNFGPAVRIEGFNCRGNNCGISAVA